MGFALALRRSPKIAVPDALGRRSIGTGGGTPPELAGEDA